MKLHQIALCALTAVGAGVDTIAAQMPADTLAIEAAVAQHFRP